MGIESGQIEGVDINVIDSLMTEVEPATLSVASGKNLSPQERDIERAKKIKAKL